MLPLHDRVTDLFDTVEGKHHQRTMDNIYNSAKVFKESYNREKNYRLMVLQGKEQEESHHALHKRNLIQRRQILIPGEQQGKELWKGIQNVPTLLNIVCLIPILYTKSVWFQNI